MIRKLIFLAAAAVLFAAGCVEDNGNYDYTQLTPIEIDMGLNSSTVVVKQLGTLKISPTVAQGGSSDNLTYRWQLKDDLNLPDPATGYFIDSLLSTDRVLDMTVDLPARNYHLIYYVTDKRNGVTVNEKLNLKVQTIAPQGLMVLHEQDGSCDVSMVMNPEVNASIEGYTEDYTTHAIFSNNNGNRRAEGEGVTIVAPRNGGNSIYLFMKGTRGGYRLSIADMKIISNYEACFRDGLEGGVHFEGFNTHYSREFLVNNGSVYFSDSNTENVYAGYDVKSFSEDTQGYEAAPYVGVCGMSYHFGVFYDRRNHRFMRIDNTLVAKKFLSKGDAFDVSKPLDKPLEMLYAEVGYPANRWHCIMYDPQTPAARKIYDLDLGAYSHLDSYKTGVAIHDISAAADMDRASLFAFGTRGPVMFYGTPQKIYRYLYESTFPAEPLLDMAKDYPGYEVSLLWMFNDNIVNASLYGKLLYAGIWNPTTGDGKLLQYVVSETNGTVESGPKVYEGFGKIVSLGYKWK